MRKHISYSYNIFLSSSWNDCVLAYFSLNQTSMSYMALLSGEHFGKLVTANNVLVRTFFVINR